MDKQRSRIIVILVAIILAIILQSLSKPLYSNSGKDSSVSVCYNAVNDTIASAIKKINERFDGEIERQDTNRNYIIIISFFAAFAASASAYVAIRQYQNAKLQKRILLFEKRFQIYDIIRKTMVGAEKTRGYSLIKEILGFPTYISYLKGAMDKELFFRKDTCDDINGIQVLLQKLYNDVIEMEDAIKLKNNEQIKSIQNDIDKLTSSIKNWTDGNTSKLTILFKTYLEFRKP